MRRPSRRQLLGLSYLPALYVIADYFYWHRRGGAFNHR